MTSQDEIVFLLSRPALFLPLFLLVLFRVSGLMLTAPLYGNQLIPIRVRMAMSVAISFVLFPMVSRSAHVGLGELGLASAIPGVFGELLIGLIMGVSLSLVFEGVKLAGRVIGQQAGLSLGQVFDPSSGSQATILGQLFFWVAMTIFLLAGGHRELMRALLDTFQIIPVMSFRFNPSMLDLIVDLLTGAYVVALRLAGPVLIALLLTSIVLGFLSRTIPQINILTVGFAVRVFVAISVTSVALAAAEGLLTGALSDWVERIRAAFGLPV